MVRFDRRAGSWLVFLAIAVVSPTSATAGKAGKSSPKIPFPGALPPPPPPSPPPPAPEPMGWPHSVLTGHNNNCAREPAANEVIVHSGNNFTGHCAVLVAGFYPFAANFLVGDNKMSSIKVGSDVRARVFKNSLYEGDWNAYAPGTRSGGLGGYDNAVTSMRVEPANRSQTCDDVREGEIALYRNRNMQGDCVVLPSDTSYQNPEVMGIANDSISSIYNNSPRRMQTFWDSNFTEKSQLIVPFKRIFGLSRGGFMTNGIDDDISSIQMLD